MEVIVTETSSIGVCIIFALLFAISLPTFINAQLPSPSLVSAPIFSSDDILFLPRTAIDQGIAYVLLLLALVVTYMIR